MALASRWFLLWAALLAAQAWSFAATGPDGQAFLNASKELTDGFYQQADADFGAFVQKFPGSPLVPDAYLAQAQARVKLGNFSGAIEILTAHQAQAGKRADDYLYCQADALSQKGDPKAAADVFAKLARDYPSSAHRLEATILEARERARLDEWSAILNLLQDTNGVLQTAVRARTTNEMVARGFLLLSEAHLRKGEFAPAERALDWIKPIELRPQLSWERQFLYCRLLSATGRLEPALEASTNLMTLAAAVGQPNILAQSFGLQAELFERLGRGAEAIAAYQKNLACDVSPQRQRHALLKVTEIAQKIKKVDEAAKVLEQFIAQCPNAECGDLALLTLGELRLKEHLAGTSTNAPPGTNHLQQALAAFESFTNNVKFQNSALTGKAHLDLGWCFWLSGGTAPNPGAFAAAMAESQSAFQTASQKLPPSSDQAIAYFKLGDAQFQQTNFSGAITSYTAVVERFGSFPEVTNTLFEPALYQLVRAGLAGANMPVVTNALWKILAWYPSGFHTDRAVLLAGPEIGRQDPAEAQRLFAEVITRAPDSDLLPELELAIARTYEQEGHWQEAIKQYNTWLVTFTNQEAQARAMYAEYSRARACSQAGQLTNAFNYFTNFLARFPTNELAPNAQWWVATYYYGLGDAEHLKAAEANYQLIYQNTNWPVSVLSYQARMMAGRAAFDRGGWKDARDYFTRLVQRTNDCPPELRARAWCALGDTLISQDSTNKTADYKEALNAFSQVSVCCPSNEIAVLALGKTAECLLQLAEASQDYLLVSNSFQQVFDSRLADAKTKATARVGLGITLEKMAQFKKDAERQQLLALAKANYIDVFYHFDKYLRPGEKADVFWTREAGLRLARLAESLKEYTQALNVYLRLRDEIVPPLRLEEKIENLRAKTQQLGRSN